MKAVLYAIADCERSDVPPSTQAGRRLRAVGERRPVAVLAADGDPEPDPSATALWEHERAVAELMNRCAVLPARYGTVLAEEDALNLLEERGAELLNALEQIRGAVELGLQARLVAVDDAAASGPAGEPESAGAGTAYLRGRLAESERRRETEARLAPLRDLARAWRASSAAAGGQVVRHSYLVDRDRVAAFVAAVRVLDQRWPELELVCSGPWPPYSFTGGWA